MTPDRSLPQYLILDVLAARLRLGDSVWPFPTTARPHLRKLEKAGLVHLMSGAVEYTMRAMLTEQGQAVALDPHYDAELAARRAARQGVRP